MKKILAVAAAAILSFGLVFAQDGDSESIGSPEFELKNTITSNGESDEKGNFKPTEIENETEINFGIGFDLNDMFSLTPFIADELTLKNENILSGGTIPFESNLVKIGLELGIKPIEMLEFKLGAGFLSEVNKGTDAASQKLYSSNGFLTTVGFDLNYEDFFIAANTVYDLEAKFGKHTYGDDTKQIVKASSFEHTVTSELTFDFFNFFKEGFNSGLFIYNELIATNESGKDLNQDNSTEKTAKIENDFRVGLHFNPVDYVNLKFLAMVGFEQEKTFTGDKWNDPKKTLTAGLSLGADFTHKNFILEIEYNPTFLKNETENGNTTKFEKKQKEHEFVLALGFKL